MESSEKLSPDPYKGVRDFYPSDWARLQDLFSSIRTLLVLNGYEEYNASPLERAELYEKKGNEEIVQEQTYTFTDRALRRVTLRPEMTPTLARMVAAKRRALSFPLRWFSIGNRFRYERPQRGRLREFYQVDVDIVGSAREETDAEVLTLASKIMRSLGAREEDFIIRVNSRKLFDVLAREKRWSESQTRADVQRKLFRVLDARRKVPEEKFVQDLKELGFSPEDFTAESLSEDIAQEIGVAPLLQTVQTRGVSNVLWDPTITRGFDYYTGMVFEVYDTSPENTRALFGGGRYDGLMSLFGAEPLPAVGFGMGDVTLTDFLKTHGLEKNVLSAPTLFLGTVSDRDTPTAESLAEKLREEGISVFVNLSSKSVGEQIKEALRRSIPYFAAVGSDEASSGKLRVKRLASGEEKELSPQETADFCKR